ncbi:MarR family transcriptional regulator [Croceicoccus sp. F390]|uniref:MarR family transcriptional regulator n=1 Tax=Croceicoccus esteveae TaxID=3075597 RepID=A0ABU2ZDW6_9SPHN|nr:MarR family transcriptional regulator [Croceicoccus sp. F390]MDT0574794.1 MarR family transcriptional regulator [Croceicoccus sp. F390]
MNNIGYLLSDCARSMRRVFDERMRSSGITGAQARLLLLVQHDEGQQQSHYASKLDVEPITLCRMVDRLEDAQLLERRSDPVDRRARLTFCTPKGRALAGGLTQQVDQFIADLNAGLTGMQRDALHDGLIGLSVRLAEMELVAGQAQKDLENHG